jgi:basic amino acid/polyamine antiporter, APA family
MLPVAGGEIAYAYGAYGTGKAFLVGWFLAIGYISVSAFEAISVGSVVSFMLPAIDRGALYEVGGHPVYAGHLLLAVAATGLITALNYFGVRWAAAFQKWLIAAFLLLVVALLAAGIVGGEAENLRPAFAGVGPTGAMAGMLAVMVTVPFWFVGFDVIPQGAEEAEASVPPRRLGVLIMAAIACASLFYVVIILSVAMVGPWQEIAGADLATGSAFERAFGSGLWMNLVLTAALIGLMTSWNGFFLAGSRVLFALGRGHVIPPAFGRAHPRWGTPHRAIIVVGLLTVLAPLLGRDALISFVEVGAFCIAVAFLGVALSVPRLRRVRPDLERPYRIPGGRLVPLLAAVGAAFMLGAMLVPGSPAALGWPDEVGILAGFCVLGILFWLIGGVQRRRTTEPERAYLILERYARRRAVDG